MEDSSIFKIVLCKIATSEYLTQFNKATNAIKDLINLTLEPFDICIDTPALLYLIAEDDVIKKGNLFVVNHADKDYICNEIEHNNNIEAAYLYKDKIADVLFILPNKND